MKTVKYACFCIPQDVEMLPVWEQFLPDTAIFFYVVCDVSLWCVKK